MAQQLGEPFDLAAAGGGRPHGGGRLDDLAQQHPAMVPGSPAVSEEERYHQERWIPPDGATELLVVRHGASAAAVPGRPFPLRDGQGDPPLAPEGREQAARVAARLSGATSLFVSPFTRARETAEPIAAACGLEPVVIGDLREVHTGELEGGEFRIRVARGDPLIARLFAEERWDVIPGGEPSEAFAERVRSAAAAVVAAAGPGMAIVVSHGAWIAELCRQATESRPFAFLMVDNASITRLIALPDGRWVLAGFNDTAHLA
jgi:probable phosphoglycerate mutase